MNRTGLPPYRLLLLPVLISLGLGGCASREYVEQELARVNQRIAGLETTLGKQLEAQGARIQAAEAQIKTVEPRFLVAESRLAKGETDMATLGRRLDATQSDLAATSQNTAGLLVGLNAVVQRIDVHATQMASLQQRLEGVSTMQAKGETDMATLGRRLDATQSDLAATSQNTAGLLVGLNAAVQRMDGLAADIGGTRTQLARIEQQVGAAGQQIEGTTVTLAKTEARLAVLDSAVKDVRTTATAAAETAATAVSKAETVRNVVTTPVPTPAIEVVALPAASVKPVDMPVKETAPLPAMVSSEDLNARLSRVTALIDAVRLRVDGTLAEQGATAAAQRVEDRAALKATNDALSVVQTQLAAADKRVEATVLATADVAQRVTGIEAGLKTVNGRVEEGDKRFGSLADVQARLMATDTRVDAHAQVLGRVEQNVAMLVGQQQGSTARQDDSDKRLTGLGERLGKVELELATISSTAREALDRAVASGKLAEGKFVEETVLSEEIAFEFEKWELSTEAKTALTTLADRLKATDKRVFIEIQGYTDNSGSTTANLNLSRLRAEVVRDYLHVAAGVPMHRMAVAAYGELNPVADNKTREGRGKNRRVVLVVLK